MSRDPAGTDPGAVTVTADGIRLRVRLTPRAARDGLDGRDRLADGTEVFVARVRAVPEKGAANAAVLQLLAEAFGVPKRRVHLLSGETARLKLLAIDGDPAELAGRAARLGDPGAG